MATTIQVGGVRRRPSAPAQGGNAGGGLTEEQAQDLWDANDRATRSIEQIAEVWVGQDTNSLNSAFDTLHSKINWDREQIYRIDEALRSLKQAQGSVPPEALDEIREEITDTKTYIQALKGRWTLDFISQFYQVTDNPDEDAERMVTYAHSLKGMVDALNQYPPIENVDPEALTPGGQLLYLKNDIEQLKGLLQATREELQDLKAQQGGNQGGVSREDFETFKRDVEETFGEIERRTDSSGMEQTITQVIKRMEAIDGKVEDLKERLKS